jgi:hypothetical protein
MAQRQRRDWRDSSHYRAASGKSRRFPSGGAAVRLEPVLARFYFATMLILALLEIQIRKCLFVWIDNATLMQLYLQDQFLPHND